MSTGDLPALDHLYELAEGYFWRHPHVKLLPDGEVNYVSTIDAAHEVTDDLKADDLAPCALELLKVSKDFKFYVHIEDTTDAATILADVVTSYVRARLDANPNVAAEDRKRTNAADALERSRPI